MVYLYVIYQNFSYFAGPYTTLGKRGNAIFLPNSHHADGNLINMGAHASDCFGNISLCPNGFTFSIWFTFAPLNTTYTDFLYSTIMFFVFTLHSENNFRLGVTAFNETHIHQFWALPIFPSRDWIQVGLTYSRGSGFKVSFMTRKSLHFPNTKKRIGIAYDHAEVFTQKHWCFLSYQSD